MTDLATSNTKKCGVQYVDGIKKENSAIIKSTQIIDLEYGMHIPDKLIERFNLFDEVFGEVYECNILDNYLMRSKKLPIMYLRVLISRPLNPVLLTKFTLYFTIKSDIQSEEELINSKIDGEFTIETEIKGASKVLDTLEYYPGQANIINKLKRIVNNDIMVEYLKELTQEVNVKLEEKYHEEYGQFIINN